LFSVGAIIHLDGLPYQEEVAFRRESVEVAKQGRIEVELGGRRRVVIKSLFLY
jgi:hypothetical protein